MAAKNTTENQENMIDCSSEGEARARTLTTADHNKSPTWGGNDNFKGEQQKCTYSLML